MKPQIAFPHLHFGASCNLVFLSSSPLIFFDYSCFCQVWQPSYQDHIFLPPEPLPVSCSYESPQFPSFSLPLVDSCWGGVHSYVITSLFFCFSHLYTSSFARLFFVPPSATELVFPEGTRDVLLSTLPLLWTSVSLLWSWWALEPLQGSSHSSELLLVFHMKEKSPHLLQCSHTSWESGFL